MASTGGVASDLGDLLAAFNIPDISRPRPSDSLGGHSRDSGLSQSTYEHSSPPSSDRTVPGITVKTERYEPEYEQSVGSPIVNGRYSSSSEHSSSTPVSSMTDYSSYGALHEKEAPASLQQFISHHKRRKSKPKKIVKKNEDIEKVLNITEPSGSSAPRRSMPSFRTPTKCSTRPDYVNPTALKSAHEILSERRYQLIKHASNYNSIPVLTSASLRRARENFSNSLSPPNAVALPTYPARSNIVQGQSSTMLRFVNPVNYQAQMALQRQSLPPAYHNNVQQFSSPVAQAGQSVTQLAHSRPAIQSQQPIYFLQVSQASTNAASNSHVVPVVQFSTTSTTKEQLVTNTMTSPVRIQYQLSTQTPSSTQTSSHSSTDMQTLQLPVAETSPIKTTDNKSETDKSTLYKPQVTSSLSVEELINLDPLNGPNPIPTYAPPTPPAEFNLDIPEGGYKCPGCSDSFLFESSLRGHVDRQSVRIIFKCNFCPKDEQSKKFANKCKLKMHLKQHVSGSPAKETNSEDIQKSSGPSRGIETIKTSNDNTNKKSNNSVAIVEKASDAKDDSHDVDIKDSSDDHGNDDVLTRTSKDKAADNYCTICEKEVEDRYSHYGGGFSKDPQRCRDCNIHMPTSCSFHAHTDLHRPATGDLICPECGHTISGGPLDFIKHLNRECLHFLRAIYIECDRCSGTYQRSISDMKGLLSDSKAQTKPFWEHYMNQHSETYYKCQICPMAFKSTSSFAAHKKAAHDKIETVSNTVRVIHKCPLCNTVFNNYNLLVRHAVDMHHNEDNWRKSGFRCPWCVSSFCKTKDEIKAHMRIHVHAKVLNCSFCNSKKMKLSDLEDHMLENHFFQKKTPALKFKSKSLPLLLPKRDNGVQALVVEKVGDKVRIPRLLKPKEGIYETELQEPTDESAGITCPICKIKCASRKVLASHIRAHERENQYVCCICAQEVFVTRDDLMRHRKKCWQQIPMGPQIKTEDKRQVCSYCSERFLSKEDLYVHLKEIHGVELQFPCHLCGLTYINNHSLRRHIQIIHEGKRRVYTCWICLDDKVRKTFSKRGLLQKHITNKHKVPANQIDFSKMPKSFATAVDCEKQDEVKSDDVIIEEESGKRKIDEDEEHTPENTPVKRLKLDGDDMYSCAKCDFTTTNRQEFQGHISNHRDQGECCQCPECGMCFVVVSSLKRHLFIVHKIKRTEKYCNDNALYGDSRETKLEENWKQKDEKTLECNVCFQEFENEVLMKRHMRTHGILFIRSKRAAHLGVLSSGRTLKTEIIETEHNGSDNDHVKKQDGGQSSDEANDVDID